MKLPTNSEIFQKATECTSRNTVDCYMFGAEWILDAYAKPLAEENESLSKTLETQKTILRMRDKQKEQLQLALDVATEALNYYKQTRKISQYIAVTGDFKSEDCATTALEKIESILKGEK